MQQLLGVKVIYEDGDTTIRDSTVRPKKRKSIMLELPSTSAGGTVKRFSKHALESRHIKPEEV